jgi:hypothetical protein
VFIVKVASMCYEMMSSFAKITSLTGESMSMEHWWDDTDGKTTVLGGKPIPM